MFVVGTFEKIRHRAYFILTNIIPYLTLMGELWDDICEYIWKEKWHCNNRTYYIPSSLQYKAHLCWQLNCRSLRCSWSIACRRCSNYIFILDLIHGFNRLGKDNCQTGRESFKFSNLVRLILETLRYLMLVCSSVAGASLCRHSH